MSLRGKTKRSNSEEVGRIHEIMNFSKRYKESEGNNVDLKSDIEAQSAEITSSKNPAVGKTGFGTERRQQVQQLTRVFRPSEAETKSPFSYIEMIAQAINSTFEKKLVLADIYTYMEHRFFQYLARKPRWKNTVRHNLSYHKCFVKCEYSRRKGNRSHYWAIHPNFVEQFNSGNFRKTLCTIPYSTYEIINPRAWSGQHLACFNPNFQASCPCSSFDFPYETLENLYEISAWQSQQFASCVNPANIPPLHINPSLNFPYEPLTKRKNPVPSYITKPFTEARGQISTQREAFQLYPEALQTSYQYPWYVNPTPWQTEHVHMPISNPAMQGFHEIHLGSLHNPITSATPRNVSYTNTTMIHPKSSDSAKTLYRECQSEK